MKSGIEIIINLEKALAKYQLTSTPWNVLPRRWRHKLQNTVHIGICCLALWPGDLALSCNPSYLGGQSSGMV
jgi:hypothetical protein